MESEFLLYGANGFVGEVIARLAAQKGLKPILAGRNRIKIQALATELGLPCRVFALQDSVVMDKALSEVPFVLHCAGPYVFTAKAMADGCLRTGRHYLDLSGAIADLEAMAARDSEAKTKRVMLLPGVGFDVVPTDCLALHVKERLPSATRLTLAWAGRGPTKFPPGTLNTILDAIVRDPVGFPTRRNGQIVYGEPGSRVIDFGEGPVKAYRANWGDVSTSFYSTGIPNMEEYVGWTEQQLTGLISLAKMRPWLRFGFARNYIRSKAPTRPTAEERIKSRTRVWAEAEDDQGKKAISRLRGPEAGVTWTSIVAVAAAQKVLEGRATPGFQTPAKAFGAEFGITGEGIILEDLP